MLEISLHDEIEQRFGVLPNFFRLTSNTPEVTANLWGFAKFAYLDSFMPSLFKERLFVYLSRFCEVRYCIARHIGFLVGLSYPAGDRDCLPQTVEQVLSLLQRSLPRGEELEPAIALCAAFDPDHFEFPSLDTPSESAIFACATHVFLQTSDAPSAIAALQQGLGTSRLELLNLFLAFVRMAHYWTQTHPELRFEEDINHLLATHEALANCILNDPEVEDNALNQRVLEELAELRQVKQEHESLQQAYAAMSRKDKQLLIERQERQRIEENLRDSEARFRSVFANNMVAMGIWTIAGDITDANDALLDLIGYTRPELEAGTIRWIEITPPEYHDRDAQAITEVVAEGACTPYEKEFIHKNGHRIPILIGGGQFGDQSGAGVFFSVNLTERKHIEAVLQESEEQFRNMADNAPIMVWVTDPTGYCTYLSQSWYDFTGQTEATGLGFGWLNATHSDDRESAQAIFLAANDRARAFQLEYRLRHQDGYYRTCIDAAKPWFGVNGEFKGYIGSVIDIDDRKQAEERQAFLLKLSDALRPLTDASEIQAIAARILGESLGATRVIYTEVVSEGEEVIVHCNYTDGAAELSGRYRLEDYRRNLTADHQAGRTQAVIDIPDNPKYTDAEKSKYREIEIAAHIDVPLIKNNQFVALLAVHQSTPRQWTEIEINLVEETAELTWAAVERARAEVALRKSEARLTADLAGMQRLYDLYATLATGLDLKTALNEILVVACEFTQTDRGCVQLVSDDGTRLEMFTWHGYSDDSPFINHFRYEGFKEGCDQARVARQRFVIEETIGYPGLEGTEAGAAAYAEGIRAAQSTPIINRSGESIGVLSTQFSQPHRPSDDELKLVDLLAWTAADFVERYRAHTALGESEKKYRSLFESLDQGFCLLEVLFDANDRAIDYRYLDINKAFERQSGLVDAVGKTILELVPNLEPQWAECYEQVVKSGEAVRFEADVPSMNRFFDIYAFPIGAPGQNLVAVLFADILDRKQAEAIIATDLANTRLLHDLSARLINEDNTQVLYDEIVAAAIALTQADAGTVQILDDATQDVVLLATQGFDRTITDYFYRVNASSNTSCGVALTTLTRAIVDFDVPEGDDPHGSLRLLANAGFACAQSTPLISRSGKALGMVSTHWRKQHRLSDQELRFLDLLARQAADLIEQRQTEAERKLILQREQAAREEAERANRIKDEFLAVLSHELRSPLNPILGWAKLLQRGNLNPERTTSALEIIERNAQLQSQLISDLLDISRILQGKLSLDQKPVDLRMVITSALETVRLAAVAKSLHIETTFSPDFRTVSGDAGRLQQVAWNLLSNAVKFTPQNGQITVALTQTNTYAHIQVTDTGIGINPEFLPYVFEHFRQEDAATTRKFGGLGLGLAIARQIVEMHGGTIAVDSFGEGQGATFTVQIPLAPHFSERPSTEFPPDSIEDLTGSRILVVDDETDSREFVAFVLEQAGAIVINVTSGIEALQVIGQSVPDLIISDIGMPEMDGYMLMRQIRALKLGRQIPAIALTAYAGELDQQQARASGFQRHLAKPVSPTEIIAVVAHLCGQKGQMSV